MYEEFFTDEDTDNEVEEKEDDGDMATFLF